MNSINQYDKSVKELVSQEDIILCAHKTSRSLSHHANDANIKRTANSQSSNIAFDEESAAASIETSLDPINVNPMNFTFVEVPCSRK